MKTCMVLALLLIASCAAPQQAESEIVPVPTTTHETRETPPEAERCAEAITPPGAEELRVFLQESGFDVTASTAEAGGWEAALEQLGQEPEPLVLTNREAPDDRFEFVFLEASAEDCGENFIVYRMTTTPDGVVNIVSLVRDGEREGGFGEGGIRWVFDPEAVKQYIRDHPEIVEGLCTALMRVLEGGIVAASCAGLTGLIAAAAGPASIAVGLLCKGVLFGLLTAIGAREMAEEACTDIVSGWAAE